AGCGEGTRQGDPMTGRHAAKAFASLVAVAASLAACGKDDGGSAKGGGAAPTAAEEAAGIAAPRGKPDGAAWDAIAWVRSSDSAAAEVVVVDAAAARAALLSGKDYGRSEGLADA